MSFTKYATPAEKTIVGRLIRAAHKQGWTISVHDGEEWALKRSRDLAAVRAALASTDSDNVVFRDVNGEPMGSVLLIWGNDEDVISDMSAPNSAALDDFSAWVDLVTRA